ncbi:cation:proton antiporter [Sphingomonas rubra]|uniref:Sodium/proton antiporter, CPA1 family (TC 2.A.36) n=1 Tax=Sphingomonas rubra TaxID=634430 RepID=A0A1I5RPX4_9SPHN|nr:sodium:proton antiporter [Sphingomonas rubra]SFP60568.1 sodium/proton antiporter, CPA1 family (TC 2.A.36) [Sphingomonas rubra]
MDHLAIVIACVGLIGIGAQWIAWRTGLPAIALMLVAGLVAGPITGMIRPAEDFGHLLEPAVSLAVAVILFEGGLSLNLRELRHAEGAVHRLVLIGVPVGWVLGALACYYVAGLVWPVAILFAGILVVTGPTVVLPLLRQSSIAARPRAILKWEAIVNDPIGALCAVVTYEILRQAGSGATVWQGTVSLLIAAAVAGLIGYGVARALGWALPRGHVPEYLKAPVMLVAVIGTFVGSNAIQQETGLLAVTVMGIALANMNLASLRDFLAFKENMTIILVSGVFVLLSASLDLAVLRQFEWRFGLFLAALLFVVRPATVFVSLAFSRIPWRERLFIGWIAPRGIVAVAISGLFALRLDELGYGDGGTLVALSFAVVAATIVAHGFSIGTAARLLGITAPGGNGLLVVGATRWSLGLARALRSLGVGVTVADTSWQRLAPAREEAIPSYHGEILAEATEEGLDLQQFGVLAATTENEAYNALVCNEFAPELGRDNVYQLGDAAGDDPRRLPAALRGRTMFRSGLGVEDVAAREEAGWTFAALAVDDPATYAATVDALPDDGGPLLLLRRNGSLRFFSHASDPTPVAGETVLVYAPRDRLNGPSWQVIEPAEIPRSHQEVSA